MATYKVTDPLTNKSVTLTGDSPPTEGELNDIFSKIHGTQSQPSNDMLGLAPGQGVLRKAAQLAYSPVRGFRGIGVGLQKLQENVPLSLIPGTPVTPSGISRMIKNVPNALERASAATKPGYVPQKGERIGSTLGETAGLVGMTAPLAASGGSSALGQIAAQGATGAGISALEQESEQGKVSPGKVALMSALSAAPIAALKGARKIFPPVAGGFTKTPPAAYENLTSGFKKAYPGTKADIEAASSKVAPALEESFGAVGKKLAGRQKYMGMEMTPKEALAEVQATGGEPRTPSRIASEFKDIQKRSAPLIEKQSPSALINPKTGQPFIKTTTERGIPKGEKLRRLSDFETDINKETGGSYTSDVYQLKQAIRKAAEKTGGVSYKILTKFKQQWGELKGIEEQLGTKLSDPETSGRDIENIVRKQIEKPDKLTSSDLIKLSGVSKLEEITGKPIIEPLKKQILSSYTNKQLSDFVPRGMLGKILLMKYWPEGLASFVMGSPQVMGKVAQGLYSPSISGKAVRSTAPALLSRFGRNQDTSQ